MAQPRTSSRDQRLQRLAYIQSLEQPQAPQPQQPQQTDLLGQLGQLYSLQQNVDLDPLRRQAMEASLAAVPEQQRAARLANDAVEFANAWAQPNAMAKSERELMEQQALRQQMDQRNQLLPAQMQAAQLANDKAAFDLQWAQPNEILKNERGNLENSLLSSKLRGEVIPTDILEHFTRTQQTLPPELQYLIQTPQSQAFVAKAAEDKRIAQEQDKQRVALQVAASQGDQNAVAQLQQMGFVNVNAPTVAPAGNLPGFWEALNQLLGNAFDTRNVNIPGYNPMVTNTAEVFRR